MEFTVWVQDGECNIYDGFMELTVRVQDSW
jgi:hypothetical protein